jgi:uncharacterized protein YutE (UPF0331/DUF86 family)
MNERIRQLAEQAGIYKLNLSDETEYWIMEKFAELIVQKCADIGEQYADGNYEVYNNIVEYFGMQEPEE